jgi:hypothetical protein
MIRVVYRDPSRCFGRVQRASSETGQSRGAAPRAVKRAGPHDQDRGEGTSRARAKNLKCVQCSRVARRED